MKHLNLAVLIVVAVFGTAPLILAEDPAWRTYDPGFRVLDVTDGASGTLWVCGSDASIAASQDNGAHWEIRDQVKGAGLLLTIRFRGSFGFAVGTAGYVAFTEDAGTTWRHLAVPYRDVLSGSFWDETHGLLRTRSAVLSTVDGKTWISVSDQNAPDFRSFPYVLGVAALDASHMAIHISEPPPSRSGFLVTTNSGAAWNFVEIPNTTITSLLVQGGKYWAVGTEVIHKGESGGGNAVPLALYSLDGEKWDHTQHDIQMCHWEGCGGTCTDQGCLAASGLVLTIFDELSERVVFDPNPDLTVKWAMARTAFCFVGRQLECTDSRVDPSADAEKMEGTTPTSDAQPLVKPGPPNAVECIVCGLSSIYVDAKANGIFHLKLSLLINTDGLVESVEMQGAPSKTLQDSITQSVLSWVFVPFVQAGVPVNVKLNTTANVMVVKPR